MAKTIKQWSLTDSVSVLPGCGPTKTQRLSEKGVRTLQDLLNYNGLAPQGVNVAQMRFLTAQGLGTDTHVAAPAVMSTQSLQMGSASGCPTLTEHSWFNLAGHVLQKARPPTRVHIGQLIVAPYGVVLGTSWLHRGQWKFRAVSPLMLACTHVLWKRKDIISDDSDEDVDELHRCPTYLAADTELPRFTVDTGRVLLNEAQSDMLKLALREVSLFQQHSVLSQLED